MSFILFFFVLFCFVTLLYRTVVRGLGQPFAIRTQFFIKLNTMQTAEGVLLVYEGTLVYRWAHYRCCGVVTQQHASYQILKNTYSIVYCNFLQHCQIVQHVMWYQPTIDHRYLTFFIVRVFLFFVLFLSNHQGVSLRALIYFCF